jgi:predicted DNA-binding transcriptional regulator AlpA
MDGGREVSQAVQLGGYAVAWPEDAIEAWIAARLQGI